jgi:hypothetical protein
MDVKIEKLTSEDMYVMELVMDRINQLIDKVDKIEKDLTDRLDNNWKHHKHLRREIDSIKESLGTAQTK